MKWSSDRTEYTVMDGVYPPAEDTFLLVDTVAGLDRCDLFVEVGCGAGLVTMAGATIARQVIATDISVLAIRNTRHNLREHGLDRHCHLVQCDLLEAFRRPICASVIVFNPPYLPDDEERSTLDHALVGGSTGPETAVRFVRRCAQHLAPGGEAYIVVSSLGGQAAVISAMKEAGLLVDVVATEHLFFEKISILRGRHVGAATETVL